MVCGLGPWPSKVGLSEGVISLEIRCELDYLHGELYFLITATSVPPRIYAFETDKTGLDLVRIPLLKIRTGLF